MRTFDGETAWHRLLSSLMSLLLFPLYGFGMMPYSDGLYHSCDLRLLTLIAQPYSRVLFS